ncbi:MAG: MFS transporter, partial [Acidobacteriota bacterium]|nr:MFS transporter [Acidobacteriota bacterium]
MLAAVMMAAFIAAMENSIVATAMPDDGRQALADSTCSAGHLPAYLLTQAATIPIMGASPISMGANPCSSLGR